MDKAATPFARRLKKIKLNLAHKTIKSFSFFPESWLINGAQFGQSVEFHLWTRRNFGKNHPFLATREQLWNRIIQMAADKRSITVFEFGVAYGYATNWWLENCRTIDHWYGFDTFTGLPEAWQHYERGAFDAGGKPPAIKDQRVEWFKGKVEKTFSAELFQQLNKQSSTSDCRVFLFDLDLYEPTRHVLDTILSGLRKDDILYFDEAADFDERRVIVETKNVLMETGFLIGSTPVAMAFWREI